MPLLFVSIFVFAFFLSIINTIIIRQLALKFGIIDQPEINGRKIHLKPIPLLGGLAIFLSFFVVLFLVYFSPAWPVQRFRIFQVLPAGLNLVTLKQIIGLFLASLFLMIGGFLDDKYRLKPQQQIIWPILACLVVITSGIGIRYTNNPFGSGYIFFDRYKFEIFRFRGIPFYIVPLADLFTFFWLMILMYATKLLDGLDGLVSGVSTIGGLVIAGLCLLTKFYQPEVGVMAIIFAGVCLGFLIFNFYPAKIFLGEGGSLFTGFMLGNLAIISGSKVVTAFLVLGIPILDLFWVIIKRIFIEHKSPFLAGREHLHFQLLKLGLSHRLAVLCFWLISAIFGSIALFLRTKEKIILFLCFLVLSITAFILLEIKNKSIKKFFTKYLKNGNI